MPRTIHGDVIGKKKTPEYTAWNNMRSRCNNPNDPGYINYGGRGISVCARWDSFANFLFDMGRRPTGHSIDRIDNDRPYEPGNCRWADRTTQNQNKRGARLSPEKADEIRLRVASGETQYSLAKEFGVGFGTVHAVVHFQTWRNTPMGKAWEAKQAA